MSISDGYISQTLLRRTRPETPWDLEKEGYLRKLESYNKEIQEVRTSLSAVSEDYNSKDLYKYIDNIPTDELQRTTNKYTRNGWKIFSIFPSMYDKSSFMICFENLNYTYNKPEKELKL